MASIRKRGSNSYLIVVSRGYDYEGNRLKSVQKTVKPPKEYTPKQAEKWVREQAILFEREVQHTPEPINRSITLAKYIEHWAADIGPKKLADSTYQRDLQDIRRILPTLGNYKLTALRKEAIRDFYEEMRHSPRLDGRGNLSEKSVEGLHNTLCGILSAAVDEGYLTHNPAWRCYKPKGQKKERPVADEETVKKLITAFEGQSMKYETYFKLVLATGLRRGEACGLRWSDINWRKRTIHVQRGVIKLSHQESITKDPKTSSGDRLVYLSKEILNKKGADIHTIVLLKYQNDKPSADLEKMFPSAQIIPVIVNELQTYFLEQLIDISDKLSSEKLIVDISCIHTPEMFVLLKYLKTANPKEKLDIAYSTPFEYDFPEEPFTSYCSYYGNLKTTDLLGFGGISDGLAHSRMIIFLGFEGVLASKVTEDIQYEELLLVNNLPSFFPKYKDSHNGA